MTIFNTIVCGDGNTVRAFALGDAKNAVEGDKVVLNENNIDENPIPYTYLAEVPVNNVFTANETLTGFVKENDGGSLTVSTVEDPNKAVSVVPDEAGLKTTINYGGGAGGINPNLVIASGVTKSGTDLSGFTKNAQNKVTTDSPFTSLSSVSFFDIVMCATHPADGGAYHWLAGLTDNANAYRGFELRTEGNNFLEALIYHEDGTRIYLKSGTTLPTNTKTFIKLSYNSSSGYTMSFSSDGISYTQVASVAITKPMELTPPILYLGWRPPKQQSAYYWNGTIHLADCYIKVNGTKIWSGVKVSFGSVMVGRGYYKQFDGKYISYDGGYALIPDILERASEMYPYIVYDGILSQAILSSTIPSGYVSHHKVNTPVYLSDDLTYITG